MNFIPANEKPWFIWLFSRYVNHLFKRRFKHVWLKQCYYPRPAGRTLYFANHNLWWDGLIPLLLNTQVFGQQARAIMEDRQMATYPFFRWIGAFSVNRSDTRKAIYSLRYALQSMQRQNASLYIYPEGEIRPFLSSLEPTFEGGLSWLITKLPDVDVVPLSIFQHSRQSAQPELFIQADNTIDIEKGMPQEALQKQLEKKCGENLRTLSLLNLSKPSSYGFIKLA